MFFILFLKFTKYVLVFIHCYQKIIIKQRNENNILNQLKVSVGYKIMEHLRVFAAPTINLAIQSTDYDNYFELENTHFSPKSVLYEHTTDNVHLKGWVGITAGVCF